MDTKVILEIVGYIGSALVVVSMLMSSIIKLRIINIVGSFISGTYSVLCGAWPLVALNASLIIINLYNLFKLKRNKKAYDLLEVSAEAPLINYFLKYYNKDIKKYFPDFKKGKSYGDNAYVVCLEGVPAGIMLGFKHKTTFDINIEYAIPAYRDCSVGKYLYSNLKKKNITKLQFIGQVSEGHSPYLKKMGYVSENGVFVKNL